MLGALPRALAELGLPRGGGRTALHACRRGPGHPGHRTRWRCRWVTSRSRCGLGDEQYCWRRLGNSLISSKTPLFTAGGSARGSTAMPMAITRITISGSPCWRAPRSKSRASCSTPTCFIAMTGRRVCCRFTCANFGGDPEFAGARTLLTIHNLGYQGLFDAVGAGEIGLGQSSLQSVATGILGQGQFSEGRDRFFRCDKHREPEVCRGDPDAGIRVWARRPAAGAERRAERDFERRRLRAVESRRPIATCRLVTRPKTWQASANASAPCCAKWALPERMIDRPLLGIVSRFATQKGLRPDRRGGAGYFRE